MLSDSSRSSVMNTEFGQTDSCDSTNSSLPVLKQSVEETCSLVERVLGERDEREQFGSGIEGKEREIREQRVRKRRETRQQARELEEASRWPRRQEGITGPWCDCRNENPEVRSIQFYLSRRNFYLLTVNSVLCSHFLMGERWIILFADLVAILKLQNRSSSVSF